MQKKITLKVLPSEAADSESLRALILRACSIQPQQLTGYNMLKQSIDARGRQTWFHLTLQAFIDEPFQQLPLIPLQLKDVHGSMKTVIIIGAGPAGLFAALR